MMLREQRIHEDVCRAAATCCSVLSRWFVFIMNPTHVMPPMRVRCCGCSSAHDIHSSIHSGSFHCPGCCPLILKGSKSKQKQKASVGEVTFLWPPRKLNIIVGEDQNKSWTLTCCSCPEVSCDVGEDNKQAPLSWWHLSLDCENNPLIQC